MPAETAEQHMRIFHHYESRYFLVMLYCRLILHTSVQARVLLNITVLLNTRYKVQFNRVISRRIDPHASYDMAVLKNYSILKFFNI